MNQKKKSHKTLFYKYTDEIISSEENITNEWITKENVDKKTQNYLILQNISHQVTHSTQNTSNVI